jgi:hypothetical protein
MAKTKAKIGWHAHLKITKEIKMNEKETNESVHRIEEWSAERLLACASRQMVVVVGVLVTWMNFEMGPLFLSELLMMDMKYVRRLALNYECMEWRWLCLISTGLEAVRNNTTS